MGMGGDREGGGDGTADAAYSCNQYVIGRNEIKDRKRKRHNQNYNCKSY